MDGVSSTGTSPVGKDKEIGKAEKPAVSKKQQPTVSKTQSVYRSSGSVRIPTSVQQHRASPKPVGAKVDVNVKALGSKKGDQKVEVKKEAAAAEADAPAKPQEFYDKIIAGLSNKDSFDHEAVRKTVDAGLSTLREVAKEGVEGVTVQLGASDHIILYLGKGGVEKSIKYSGQAQPTKQDPTFIAAGTFGLVQKVGDDIASAKAFKTIRLDKGEVAKQDIQNAMNKLRSLHAAHPEGRVPGLEGTPRSVRVAVTDPATGKQIFIDGGLSRLFKGDVNRFGPDEDGNLPNLPFVVSGYVSVFSAVGFMHSQGMAHRDIKPGNIFFDDKGFYVGDLGGVRKPSEWDESNYESGTPQYMTKQDYDAFQDAYSAGDLELAQQILEKADVYAIAASIWETFTGYNAYDSLIAPSADDPDYMDATAQDDELFQFFGQFSPQFETFMRAAMNPDRDARPSAIECADLMRKAFP